MSILTKRNIVLLISLAIFLTIILYFTVFKIKYEYYPSGNVEVKIIVNRLRGNVRYIEYHENANIKAKYETSKGEVDGEYSEFYPNGQLKFLRHYKNGLNVGSITSYYSNGDLDYKGQYKDGKFLAIEVFDKKGDLKAINKFYNKRLYYKEVLVRNEQTTKVDTVKELFPLITLEGNSAIGDTIQFKLLLLKSNTPYHNENLFIRYDLVTDIDTAETVTLPYPRFSSEGDSSYRKTGRFIIESDGYIYFYGWIAQQSLKNEDEVLKEFIIQLPKDSFKIDYPSLDTLIVIK